MYLIFKTLRSAFTANAVIAFNMRLAGSVTVGWADVQEIVSASGTSTDAEGNVTVVAVEGTHALLKPDEQYMEWVSNYVEAESIELVGSGEI